jgi:flagellar hook-associated protein 2
MNSAMGTNNTQYVSVRSDYSGGNWNFSIYETTVDDYQIEIAGTDAGSIRDEIGFAEASTPTTSSVSKIEKYFLSDTLANLRTKMTDVESGLVGGIFYEVNGDLTEGTFSFAQDASLKVAADTYTSYYTTEKLATGASLNTTTKGLENAGFAETVSGDTNGTFTINDTQITIDDYSKITVNELIGKINASGAGVTATYDSANDKFTLTSNTPGSGTIDVGGFGDTSNILQILKLDFASNPEADLGSTEGSINSSETLANAGLSLTPVSGTFTINGVSIYVDASEDSLSDLMEKVNQSGAGVTMSYDSVSDKVALKSDTINAIEVGSADDSSNILEVLNLTDDTNVSKTIGAEGQRAIVTVDGTQYVRDSNSISDIINGVTFDINGTSSEPVSLNVEVDTDKGVETIAKLIAHYNSVMEKLNVPEIDEDEEDKYKVALTDTDKESMSESDIETYEEKYKQYNTYDIIRKSSEFRNLDVIMRKHFFAERSGINDRMNSMSDLGIKVAGDGDIDIEKYGYLVEVSTDYEVIAKALKENDDFMDKLKNNSDDVFNFFASTSEKYETDKATLTDKDTTNDVNLSSFDYPDLGWARFYDQMLLERYTGSDGMIGNKLGLNGAITNELNRLEKRIEDQQRRAEGQLERYWAEFTAMEKSIAQSQAMAADFSNAGGGG